MPDGPARRLVAALEQSRQAGRRVIAIGWATVELDRAAREIATDLDHLSDPFVPAAGSQALGAFSRVGRELLPGGVAVVLLEPSTEGRLAERLARSGEGPAAAWLAAPEDLDPDVSAGRVTDGPFGPERRLASDGGPIDRFLVVAPPGTIAP